MIVLREFQRALGIAWRDAQFRALGFIMGVLLLIGTIYYHGVEGWSLFDSLYFCVITLATVGYGDFSPHTVAGKAFTIVYVMLGIGVLVALLTRVADALLVARQEAESTPGHRPFGLRRLGARNQQSEPPPDTPPTEKPG
ncbi:MAG TPA: potassium channel family protein [Caldilineaceae bacterium]|nr:potassium channel family protein [Caldilineaceae bacterium]